MHIDLIPGYSKIRAPGVGAFWHRWIRADGALRAACNVNAPPARDPAVFVERPLGKKCRSCLASVAFMQRHGALPSGQTLHALRAREPVEAA